jgi:hypothetical protein
MKASQNRFQSNEIADSTLSTPMTARAGNRIPSTLQWTLPQARPFIRQPIPAHPTVVTQRAPVAFMDSQEKSWASLAPIARTMSTPRAGSTWEPAHGSSHGTLASRAEQATPSQQRSSRSPPIPPSLLNSRRTLIHKFL